jgi:hypothetical protein
MRYIAETIACSKHRIVHFTPNEAVVVCGMDSIHCGLYSRCNPVCRTGNSRLHIESVLCQQLPILCIDVHSMLRKTNHLSSNGMQ